MRTSLFFAGLVVLVLLTDGVSFGAPSSLGPTGILNVPTAETVTPGAFDFQFAYDRPKVAGVGIDVFPIVTLNYGFANGEVGVNYFNVKGTAVTGVNGKYVFVHESARMPSIAAGLMYMSGNTAETDVYLVASDSLGLGDKFKGTAGLLFERPNYSGSNSNLTAMTGIEYGAPGQTTFGIDYIFHDIAAGGMYGATVCQPITRDLACKVGVGNDSRFFVGLIMKFGGK